MTGKKSQKITKRVQAWAAADAAGLSLWSPVAIAGGAGLYFGLNTEPPAILGVSSFVAAAIGVRVLPSCRRVAIASLLFALGFIAADLRTALVSAPQLTRELGIKAVTGKLIRIEEGGGQRRYVIELAAIEGLASSQLPARARISWKGKEFAAVPGDMVTVRAGLSPPPPPAAPGGFDFARQLYFQRIGAVGFAVTPPLVAPYTKKGPFDRIGSGVEKMRFALFKRITAAAPGEGGAIIAAIVTGKRDAITDRADAALRDTGLAHLLAISGLHMGLACGLVFFSLRAVLAAVEPLALRFPIKKWAACGALASGLFYFVLSGGGWSARRAFLMTAIMLVAILVDRRALTLRNVATAAIAILVTTPEALFHPGFQMSFAAVTALIAAYEWLSARADPYRGFDLITRVKRYGAGLAITDVIAALATAPYALYHFNRVAIFSLPANLAAMPVMAFWIAPAALIALLLAPFGLDAWAWRLAAYGMETILFIAGEVAGWPGAVSVMAQWPLAAMLTLTIGGLWLCLLHSPLRLGGLTALPIAAIMVAAVRPPDLFISASGLNAGVADYAAPDGAVIAFNPRKEKFAIGVWKEAAGFVPERAGTIAMRDVFNCDEGGCAGKIGRARSVTAVYVDDPASLAEDCARADIVVAFYPASPADWRLCQAVLIDRRAAWRRGAHAVWVRDDGSIKIKSSKDYRGARPWTGE